MDKVQFWKNFKLGKELDISGRFIYNGLKSFHEMKTLYYEEEIFEVLYNLSVGLERLLKIAVILIKHNEFINQDEFEKSLITHNHLNLLKQIKENHTPAFAGPHNEFLQMLSVFYKTHRYGKYSLTSMTVIGKEKAAFHSYIKKHLKIAISDEFPLGITQNNQKFRKFVGKIVGKITSELYEIIKQEATRLNIYTYELRYDSKASKIFLRKEYEFTNEDILWKELLIYFVNSSETSGNLGFIKEIEPLEFDPGLDVDYLQCLGSDEKKLIILDELKELYENIDKPIERLQAISLIGNPSVFSDLGDEDDEQA